MIQNYMLLPFYENINQQFRYRDYCKQGEELKSFRIPNYMAPAFFFKREKRPQGANYYLQILDLNGNVVVNITPQEHLHIVNSATYDGIGMVANRIQNTLTQFDDPDSGEGDLGYDNYLLPCGKYYYKFTEDDKEYFSEVFEVVEDEAITNGIELVKNGGFDGSFANWSTSGSWSISGGTPSGATYVGGGTGSILSQVISNAEDDDMHFYRVSFNLKQIASGNPERYLRIFFNGTTDFMNSVEAHEAGEYVYYVKNVSRIDVKMMVGHRSFIIDDFSVQKIVGHSNHVSMLLSKNCKFPNSVDVDNYRYFNYFLLDALIAAPEYGEVIKEDENGEFEKVDSFVRPFKKHQLAPVLLPEVVADAFAQLNTFDFAEVFDSYRSDIFRRNSEARLTLFRSIQGFEFKPEWQGDDCYQLAVISFEENLALHDKCCDDNDDVIECFDPNDEDSAVEIAVVWDTDHFHISLANTPEGLSAAFVRLWFKKEKFTVFDCDAIGANNTDTGIVIPFSEFEENGIDYYANDADLDPTEAFGYKFRLGITQLGCEDDMESNEACAPCIPGTYGNDIVSADFDCYDTYSEAGTDYWLIQVDLDVTLCGGTCVVEFYDTDSASWKPASSVSGPITEGPHSYQLLITQAALVVPTTLTKMRLNFNSGAYYSPEFSFATLTACP